MHQSIIICVLGIKTLPNPRSQCQDFIWSLLKRERDPVVRIDFCLVLIDVLKLSWPVLSSHCIATQKSPGTEEQGRRRWVDVDIRKRSLTKRRSNRQLRVNYDVQWEDAAVTVKWCPLPIFTLIRRYFLWLVQLELQKGRRWILVRRYIWDDFIAEIHN